MHMDTNKSTSVRVTSIAVGLTLLLLASTLDAQPPVRKAGPDRNLKILQDFDRRLVKIDKNLTQGEYKKAYQGSSRLLEEMNNSFISGPAIGRFLGLSTVLKAIAAYHLDRKDEALWHWHIATQMYPDILNYQMTAYGNAGPFLKDHLLPEDDSGVADDSEQLTNVEPSQLVAIKAPRKKRTPQPTIPTAKRGSGRVTVKVQVVIGVDGRVRQPRILGSSGELTLVYATFEALRNWKFRPAQLADKPVEVYYSLDVNFKP